MPTIIDSLIVTLGIKTTGYDNAKKKVDKGLVDTGNTAEKTGNKLQSAGDAGAKGMLTAAGSALKFLAIIGGTASLTKFVGDLIESNAALDRLSQNLGTGVSTISAWSQAAELVGGSAEGLQGTLDMLSKSQTELQLTGESGLIPYFSALGVALGDVQGKARPVDELLVDLAERFSHMDRTTANNMGRMMGIDQGAMNLLLKGRAEVETMIKRQKEYGAVSKQQAEEATRLQRAMVEGRQAFAAFGRELLSVATPAIEALFSAFTSMGNWIRDNSQFVKAFLTIMAAGLAAIAAATIPINLTAVAVTALAASIAALWDDYKTWKTGGQSFIDWSKWEPGIKAAGKGIAWLRDLISDMVYRAIAAADVVGALWNRDWKRLKFAAGEFMNGTGKKYGEEPPSPAKPASQPPRQPQKPGDERAALDYFQKQGWTREQSTGIVANLKRESALKPDAVGDSGKAYGVAQWHPDRQAEFKKQFGKDIKAATFEEQLAFVQFELTAGKEKSAGDKLRKTTTAQDAAEVMSKNYERPRDTEKEAAIRGKMATSMLPSVHGIPGASGAAQGAGAPQVAESKLPPPVAQRNIDSRIENNIGEIKVYTQATDAQGIARDMERGMDYLFASQANYGLT